MMFSRKWNPFLGMTARVSCCEGGGIGRRDYARIDDRKSLLFNFDPQSPGGTTSLGVVRATPDAPVQSGKEGVQRRYETATLPKEVGKEGGKANAGAARAATHGDLAAMLLTRRAG
ncbi:hypothetical protein [Paraburkholderia hospita]|jgi:hypothetical protein|uniref:hypothetical protein n=1 Tax=Paraburkholderia hospita TaxID=169430 RepID=UPI0009A89D1F|nr:hypothetical protein [Paraburkholderia hospita]